MNEGSAWVIEPVNGEYINTSIYNPLSGNSYIELPAKLRKSMKDFINIKNKDNKCFLWCHIRQFIKKS